MNKKIDEILKKASPPSKIDEMKKQRLKNQLMDSEHFRKKSIGKTMFQPKFAFSFIVLIVALTLVITNLFKQPVTIEELRSKVQTQYAGLINTPGFIKYGNSLTVKGSDSYRANFYIDQVFQPSSNNYQISVMDENKLEVLDKIIIKNGRVYRMEKPKIRTVGTLSSLSANKVHVFFLDDSAKSKGMLRQLDEPGTLISQLEGSGMLVYSKPEKENIELPGYRSKPFYQKVPKEVDLDEYFRTNPIELAEEISISENAKVKAPEGDGIYSVQIINRLNDRSIKAYSILLREVDSINGKKFSVKMNDSSGVINFTGSNWINFEGDSLNSIEEVKTIFLSQRSGEIKKVQFGIKKNEKQINLSEVRFAGFQKIEADTSLFDPRSHGLVFVGRIN